MLVDRWQHCTVFNHLAPFIRLPSSLNSQLSSVISPLPVLRANQRYLRALLLSLPSLFIPFILSTFQHVNLSTFSLFPSSSSFILPCSLFFVPLGAFVSLWPLSLCALRVPVVPNPRGRSPLGAGACLAGQSLYFDIKTILPAARSCCCSSLTSTRYTPVAIARPLPSFPFHTACPPSDRV